MLIRWQQGDRVALEQVTGVIYQELRRIARARLRNERANHTLETAALVNEAYLRLVQLDRVRFQSRTHFLAIASRVMRHVLVDHARRRRHRTKRDAFTQAIGHVTGRPQTVAGGTLVVRALAGLSRVTRDAATYDDASRRFERRNELNFSWIWMGDDWITCLDLATAAAEVGRDHEARWFRERARAEAPLATW